MPQLWSTGPAYFFASQPGSGSDNMLYIGTAMIKPYIEIVPEFSPFYSDELGRKVPADMSFDMEHAFVSVELNRYSEANYQLILGQRSTDPPPSGSYGYTRMGTMILAEGNPIQVSVVFPYSTLSAYAGMPAGYTFPNCVFSGPDKFTGIGIADRSLVLAFHALPDIGDGDYELYNFDVSGLLPPDDDE